MIGASWVIFAASMVLTALPSSSFRCSPVTVLTISSSWTGAGSIAKSSVTVSPGATWALSVTGLNPSRSTRTW